VKRSAFALPLTVIAGALFLACVEIPTGAEEVLSFEIDPLPSPSVVAGDSLRDTLGVVTPISVTAFNYQGQVVENVAARFRALDSRVRVDSMTGVVTGDTASATPSRILATFEGFNAFIAVPVTLRPDTIVPANDRDSLGYSLTDTAANVSGALGVKVLHGLTTTDSAVASYRVTFDLVPESDSLLARLINDAGTRSRVDTTDGNGVANRKLKIDVAHLGAAIDSVIVMANVKYKGQHVRGSPMRLVLKLRPK
jgi:hypothetical protein